MSTINGKKRKKKSTKMDSSGRLVKSKKGKNPRTPPKYGKSGGGGGLSHGPPTYNAVSKTPLTNNTNGAKSITAIIAKNGSSSVVATTPKSKSKTLRFDQPVLYFHANISADTNVNISNISNISHSPNTPNIPNNTTNTITNGQQYGVAMIPTISDPNASINNNTHTTFGDEQIANIKFQNPPISLRNLLNNHNKQVYRSTSTPASPTSKSKNKNHIIYHKASKGSHDSVTRHHVQHIHVRN